MRLLALVSGLTMISFACKTPSPSSELKAGLPSELDGVSLRFAAEGLDPGDNFNLRRLDDFLPEPQTCDAYHSKEYRCDGYTQKNLPSGPGSANPTPEIETTTAPPSGHIGLQRLTAFDPERPTVIYIHGWNVEKTSNVFGFPDMWAQQAERAGFNVMHFHWAALSYDSGDGCPGLGNFGRKNIPCTAAHNFFKRDSAVDFFLEAYKVRLAGAKAPVRLVAQSLSIPFALLARWRMAFREDFKGITLPSRIDLIDPFVMLGLGNRRDVPYDGQVPPDDQLPPEYRNNLVKTFAKGSTCHADRRGFEQANHLSQYCQTEGMAYQLVKDHGLAIFTLSSIVGSLTARNLRLVTAYQSFSTLAFGQDLTAKHTTPNASYFFSFAPGEPPGGWDASTSDATIREVCLKKLKGAPPTVRRQTQGLQTVTLMDDAFVEE